MRTLAPIAGMLVAACASGTPGGGSYGLDPGVADYDTLQAATTKCHADGGTLTLKSGYDQHELSSYECRIGARP